MRAHVIFALALSACSDPVRLVVDPTGFPAELALIAILDEDSGSGVIDRFEPTKPIELPSGDRRPTRVRVLGFTPAQLDPDLLPAGRAPISAAGDTDPLLPAPSFSARANITGPGFARLELGDPRDAPALTAPWLPDCHTVIARENEIESYCDGLMLACRGARSEDDALPEARACNAKDHRATTARSLADCRAGDSTLAAAIAEAEVLFPSPQWITDSDRLTIAGTTSHRLAIRALTVNGVSATGFDCFETWAADLAIDRHTFLVETIDALDRRVESAVLRSVRKETLLQVPTGIAYDAGSNTVLITDHRGLRKIDLASPVIEPLGEPSTPTTILLDGDRALIGDRPRGLMEVDLQTGAFTELASGRTYPILQRLQALALLEARGVALALTLPVLEPIASPEDTAGKLIAVPLDGSPPRTIANFCGAGGDCARPRGLAYDAARDRALVLRSDMLVEEISSDGADRAVYADCTAQFPELTRMQTLLRDDQTGTIYLAGSTDPLGPAVLAKIDPGGPCEPLASANSERPLIRPIGFALDRAGARLLVADEFYSALLAFNFADGSTSVLAETDAGSGPKLAVVRGLTYDRENDRLFATDNPANQILAIDPKTGDKTIISSRAQDANRDLLAGLAYDRTRNRLLAAGRGSLLSVDLATGARTVLAGSGETLITPQQIAIVPNSDRAFVSDRNGSRVLELDLSTNVFSVFSGTIFINFPTEVAASENYLVIAEGDTYGELYLFDLDTGESRSLLGANFARARIMAIAIDEPGGRVLFTDVLNRLNAVAIDGESEPVEIASITRGRGPSIARMTAVVARDLTTAIVAAEDGSQLVAVELSSGDRALVSR